MVSNLEICAVNYYCHELLGRQVTERYKELKSKPLKKQSIREREEYRVIKRIMKSEGVRLID